MNNNVYVFCDWSECLDSNYKALVETIRKKHGESKIIVVSDETEVESTIFDGVESISGGIISVFNFLILQSNSCFYVVHRRFLSSLEILVCFLSLLPFMPLVKLIPRGSNKNNNSITQLFIYKKNCKIIK
ncbi:MAG: hypothetical protein U9R29_03865 [Thermodesulfobacteriota bacterium]|nr:hypothetical protein [Thermodesulfobacteriota bacterium]